MKNIAKALVISVCVAASAGAMATEKKTSIWAQGNYSKSDGQDAFGMIMLGAGYLLNPQLEVGGQLMQTMPTNVGLTMVQITGQYYLQPVGRVNQLTPYGKAAFGVVTTAGTSGTTYGAAVGVTNAISENAEAYVEAGLNMQKTSGASTNQMAVNFGLKFRF